MNVCSNSLYNAVDFLFNKALNIPNLLYMEMNFNIRNIEWDLSASSHSVAGQTLRNLADSFSLVCSISIPTYYSDIQDHTNIVIILFFLSMSYTQVYYHIKFDLKQPSNHTPLIFDLFITPENIKKQ